MSDLIKEAGRLYKDGYDLIPLEGKKPISRNWVAAKRLSLEQLKSKIENGCNIGIRLGRELPNGRYLACLDVDIVDTLTDAERYDLEAAITRAIGDKATPPIASTGFGNESRHIYVSTEKPAKTTKLAQATRKVEYVKAGSKKRGPVWTLELRGYGAQVVLPPSVHPDTQRNYQWQGKRKLNGASSLPVLDASPHTSKAKRKTSTAQRVDIDALSIAPLYRHLLTTGETADYESRSEALYAVLAVLVRDTKLTDDDIELLVLSQPLGEKARDRPTGWVAEQCFKLRQNRTGFMAALEQLGERGEPITVSVLQPILEQAARAGFSALEREEFLNKAKAISGLSKEALATELDSFRGDMAAQQARLAHGDPVYEEIMQRHAIVSWSGKPAVFRKRIDAPPWESSYDIMTLNALATFYENKPIRMGKKAANPVEVWRADPERKEFLEGARLIPPDEQCPRGVFNLWQGFAVEPNHGPVEFWREFLSEVICKGHEFYTQWLEDWIADMFQHISDPKGVAIVLRGEEGIGKGTLANSLGAIMGSHYRHITQESQLTGRFNAHLADSCLCFGDEMTWGGDKKNRGQLYAMVTERNIMVERKNFDAVSMRNLNRFIFASNNDWVVPAGMDGRRWFVLDVSNQHKGDTQYFNRIRRQLLDGGYEAILHYYLNRKISCDLRRAPITQGLIDQKVAGFDSVAAWWAAVLERGCVRVPIGEAVTEWETRISKEILRNSYQTFCRDHGSKPYYFPTMMKRFHHYVPYVKEIRGRDGERRIQMVELPSLEACHQHLNELLGVID